MDRVTHPFPNFNGFTIEVWVWINTYFPDRVAGVVTYPCWNKSCSILVKGAPGYLLFYLVVGVDNVWIGLASLGSPNDANSYRWSSGDNAVPYKNWNGGEPNNLADENCVHIYKGFSYRWNNAPCITGKTRALCEVTECDDWIMDGRTTAIKWKYANDYSWVDIV